MWAQEGNYVITKPNTTKPNTTKVNLSAGFSARLERCSCHQCLQSFGVNDGDLPPAALQKTPSWWIWWLDAVLVAARTLSVHRCLILLFPLFSAMPVTLAGCCRCAHILCCSFSVAPGPDVWCSCSAGPEVPHAVRSSQEAAYRKLLLACVGFLVCGPTASHLVSQARLWWVNVCFRWGFL